jgi:hypothetical protein
MSKRAASGILPVWRQPLTVVLRVLGAVLGGYAFSAALVALAAVCLSLGTGLPRSEAVLLSAMAGFLLYLTVLLWAFAERRLWLVWCVLAGGAVLAYGLVRVLSPLLTGQAF